MAQKMAKTKTMKITIKMISGDKIEFFNSKYISPEEWLKENLAGEGAWFQVTKDYPVLIRVENIESIEFGILHKELK